MKKRGATNVPLILVIFFSILIIAGIVYIVLQKPFEFLKETSIGRENINLSIENVYEENGNLIIDIKRNSGEGELVGVKLILSDGGSNIENILQDSKLRELEEETLVISPTKLSPSEIKTIFIVPIFELYEEKEIVGRITNTYSLNILPAEERCIPDCIGLQCGLDSICGDLCGICDETDTCTNGICVGSNCIPDEDTITCGASKCGTKINNCGEEVNCGTCDVGTCTNNECVEIQRCNILDCIRLGECCPPGKTCKERICVDYTIEQQICTPLVCIAGMCGLYFNGTCSGRIDCGTCNEGVCNIENICFDQQKVVISNNVLVIPLVKEIIPNLGTDAIEISSEQLKSLIEKYSFNRATLNFEYTPIYDGVPRCTQETFDQYESDNELFIITSYALNKAYEGGFNLDSYDNILIMIQAPDLINDYSEFSCFFAGGMFSQGGYSNNQDFNGIKFTGGITTLGFNTGHFEEGDTFIVDSKYRNLHEFLHGYGGGSSHTSILECKDESGNQVPYKLGEFILSSEFCTRSSLPVNDIMGSARYNDEGVNINSILKKQYGWLKNSNFVEFVSEQEYTLKPIDSLEGTDDLQTIIIPIGSVSLREGDSYWENIATYSYVLEYRSNTIQYQSPEIPPVPNILYAPEGVYLYLADLTSPTEQYVLRTEMTNPLVDIKQIVPLKIGETIIDSELGLKVNVKSISEGEAVVIVTQM
jgi:hypothetical protein